MNDEEVKQMIKDDLEIDISSLEKEWVKQASNYYKWYELYAESQSKKSKAKITLEKIEANIDLDVRENPKKYKLDKITEAAVRNVIINSPGYVEANLRYIELIKNNDLLHAVVRALEHKKSALEHLK